MIAQGFDELTPLVIEDDVWIGANVIILPSAKRIGTGSIVAAGAVVVKDVPALMIVGGNPATVLRDRRVIAPARNALLIIQESGIAR
jgi:maltose O-acetyltransferase